MPDVQAWSDSRKIAIDRVGVKDITYPIRLATRDGDEISTVAKINMYVALPETQKGTHMSRFLEVLNDRNAQHSRWGTFCPWIGPRGRCWAFRSV